GIDSGSGSRLLRAALLAGMVATTMLAYFSLRASAFSPALAEARLQALTARIRPHFLFNSLNAVLSLMRAEPR
ncbi:histidine kinase, partial [bacterium]|nr:histidine kinase [bacterium]